MNPSTAVVTAVSHGLCVLRATAAETASYSSAYVDKTFTFNVNQTVSWSPTTTILITGAPVMPSSLATTTGTGAISYSVDSWATTAGCSVNAATGEINPWNVGTCVIVASAPTGNGYNPGSTSVSFTITKVQSVSWNPVNTDLQTGWSPFSGTAAASSDGTGGISYAVQSSGGTGCSINSSTRVISFTSLGACVIRATAASNGNWLTGYTDVTFRILDAQTVSWMGANVIQSSGTYTPTQATASGGGVIDYAVVSAGTTGCTVNASGVITFSSIGQCQVTATARANGFYYAGAWTQVNFNFYANQTLTWAPTNTTNPFSGGAITPNAAAVSSGPGSVTYSMAIPNASCTLNASTGAISSSVRGRCYVRANVAASGYYNSAVTPMVTFTFTGPQTVTWVATNTSNQVTHSVTPNAVPSTNGGAVTYSVASSGTAGCSVDATTGVIAATTVGTCSIRATAAAFLTYQSGFADLTFTFVEGQNISWPATNTSNPDTMTTVTPDALATSNLATAITYSVQSAGTTGCTVNSSTAVITSTAAGVCVIRATAAASGSVGSDYRDLSFTFNAPSISVSSSSASGSSIYLTAWNPRVVLVGSQPSVSIFGYGFTSDVTVKLADKTFAPKLVTADHVTFELPLLAIGAHSFVLEFGNQATITFSNAIQVISNDAVVTFVGSSQATSNSMSLMRAQQILTKLVRSIGLPVKLVCTAYLGADSTAKDRKTALSSIKRLCKDQAEKIGAKTSAASLLLIGKAATLTRKVTFSIQP